MCWFCRKLKTPKSHSEMNWPLVSFRVSEIMSCDQLLAIVNYLQLQIFPKNLMLPKNSIRWQKCGNYFQGQFSELKICGTFLSFFIEKYSTSRPSFLNKCFGNTKFSKNKNVPHFCRRSLDIVKNEGYQQDLKKKSTVLNSFFY